MNTKTAQAKPIPKGVDELIAAATAKAWTPPAHLLPGLDKLLEHNEANPTSRIGVRPIKHWLEEQGVRVGREVLSRWLRNRGAQT